MADNPWFPCFSSDALAGMSGMDAAEKGIYWTLLLLMYERCGPIDRTAPLLARQCGCTQPKLNRAIDMLISEGKLMVEGNTILNPRAAKEIKRISERRQNLKRAAKKRAKKANDFNDDPSRTRVDYASTRAGATTITTYLSPEGDKARRQTAPVEPLFDQGDPKTQARVAVDVLWQDYLRPLAGLIGKSEQQSRRIMGKLMKAAGNDADQVIKAIDAALKENPFDPVPWLVAAITSRQQTGRQSEAIENEFSKLRANLKS